MDKTYNDLHLGIKAWAEEDRPREKLMLKGKEYLTDAELIAILLGSGSRSRSAVDLAKQILLNSENNLNKLARKSVRDLMQVKGIGQAKAIAIVSALELGRRRKEIEAERAEIIASSADVYAVMKPHLLDLSMEQFWILLLNRRNTVMRRCQVSSGGVSGTVADPKVIFKMALEHLASSIILVHNHPSGNLKPSQSDISLTKKLKDAGSFLDLPILDHIIFTDNGYFSFADESLL